MNDIKQPLPAWLAEIEKWTRSAFITDGQALRLHRLLELAIAQHEALTALDGSSDKLIPDIEDVRVLTQAYYRALRLWEGGVE